MKKNLILLWLLVIAIVGCNSEKEAYIFEISGNLKNFEAENFLLQKGVNADTKSVLIAEKKQGKFTFYSKDSLAIGRYFIKIGNEPTRIPILIDNTNISVIVDPNNLSNSYTKGNSNIQKKYSNFQLGIKNTKNLFDYQKRFIEENNNSFLGALVLKDMMGPTQWRLKQSLILYEQLDSTVQYSELGKEINHYISKGFEKLIEHDNIKTEAIDSLNTTQIPVLRNKSVSLVKPISPIKTAQPIDLEYAPYFYGDGFNGAEISAKSVFAKNKLTLIDFWASWCVPCRAQNPDYVRLYKKYRSQGFEILSIASDKESAKWQNAIAADNMNWQHVIDPYNRIANMYKVKAIPYAILVNQQGGILAKKIHPNKLERLLQTELIE